MRDGLRERMWPHLHVNCEDNFRSLASKEEKVVVAKVIFGKELANENTVIPSTCDFDTGPTTKALFIAVVASSESSSELVYT